MLWPTGRASIGHGPRFTPYHGGAAAISRRHGRTANTEEVIVRPDGSRRTWTRAAAETRSFCRDEGRARHVL